MGCQGARKRLALAATCISRSGVDVDSRPLRSAAAVDGQQLRAQWAPSTLNSLRALRRDLSRRHWARGSPGIGQTRVTALPEGFLRTDISIWLRWGLDTASVISNSALLLLLRSLARHCPSRRYSYQYQAPP